MTESKGPFTFKEFRVEGVKRILKDLQPVDNGAQYFGFW